MDGGLISNEAAVNSISQLVIVVDEVRTSSPDVLGIFSGWQWEFLRGKLLRGGFSPDQTKIYKLADINQIPVDCIIVGMGEKVLNYFTDKKGIDKWHLSPLTAKTGQKFIPTYGMDRIQKQWELGLYQELAFKRAYEESKTKSYSPIKENFRLCPSIEETISLLKYIKDQPEISVDVETGYGQINTVGFAWSPEDAIAINVLPERAGDESYYNIWTAIKDVLRSDSKKIFQNFIYDTSYFSAYGIRINNITHDTMWAMKFLWPELDMNLGNVGRLYTRRPYWKDDGRVESEEGKKKDWGNVRDWFKHYTYNCRDTTGTLEAYHNQVRDLRERNLDKVFESYLKRLFDPILEMCSHGVPIDLKVREKIREETQAKIQTLSAELTKEIGFEINPGSWQQKLKYLKSAGIKVPKKYDKEKGIYRESTDSTSLKKIRLKHPEMKSLSLLTDIASLNKALSSYINFEVKPNEAKLRYSLIGTGTETLRFSGGKDPWDRGFNIQTIPREGGDVSIKSMFVAPEGESFVEVDLRQAESRFVAYDSADKTLIDMLESDYDVHSHVAKKIVRIFGKNPDDIPKEEFKGTWRQLGKKAGHGANYSMKEKVFVETCFSEMDLVLSVDQARGTLEAYHQEFPGIRRWHHGIRTELTQKRKLSAPSGWERYFYGRFGDDMFKEAYAWRPQHTIPWITNHLMLHLRDRRAKGELDFKLLVQVHDSLIMLVPDARLNDINKVCLTHKEWHPPVTLAGGQMWIPTEVKAGKTLAMLRELK